VGLNTKKNPILCLSIIEIQQRSCKRRKVSQVSRINIHLLLASIEKIHLIV